MAFTPLSLAGDHLGLYIHVPFCVRRCGYCDFASWTDFSRVDDYLAALAREVEGYRGMTVSSVYLGGGTPTALSVAQLRTLWQTVVAQFVIAPSAEVTLEANPGTLTPEMLALLGELPFTRVSLGAQSFNPRELALLGRIHGPAEIDAAVNAVKALGVQVSIDLMYALPGQRVAEWAENLRHALATQPDHISLYSLTLEEGTPLAAQVAAGELPSSEEDIEQEMYARTAELLADAGMALYEVSNAARPGYHSRHNLGYWHGRDYLGLGAAAVSTVTGVRRRNAADTASYITRMGEYGSATVYAERLSARARLLERVMLGLRLRDGFSLADAEVECGTTLPLLPLQHLLDEGLLERDGGDIRLSQRGFPLANDVVARLMLAVEEEK